MSHLKVLSGNGPRAAVRELCFAICARDRQRGRRATRRQSGSGQAWQGGRSLRRRGRQSLDHRAIDRGGQSRRRQLVADIGSAGLAVGIRAGAAKPDLSSVETFKRALIAAKAVAFPAHGASGLYFVGLLDRLGIKGEMQGKLKPMAAEDCVEVVARGEADLVVVVATRMVGVAGIEVAGPIPEALQTKIGFAAGLSASAKEPDTAKALIAFLSAPAAAATLKANGVSRRIESLRLSPVLPPAAR